MRMFASRAAPPPVPKKASAPPPAPVSNLSPEKKLIAVKDELAALVEAERKNVGDGYDADHPYTKYVKDNGLALKYEQTEQALTLSKAILGYDVKIKFSVHPDGEDGEGENEQAPENENEDADAEKEDAYAYSFVVDVKPKDAEKTKMRVYAVSAKDGKLYFEGLTVGEATEEEEYPAIDYNDLSTAMQDKLADFMDLLKIDDEFAQFVPAAAAEMQRQNVSDQLTALGKFAKL